MLTYIDSSKVEYTNAVDVSLHVTNSSILNQVCVVAPLVCRHTHDPAAYNVSLCMSRDFGSNKFSQVPMCLYERHYNSSINV